MKLLSSVIFSSLLIMQTVQASGFQKYAGEFMNLGAGSRVMGMAGAGTALSGDVSAAYWNPAGLAALNGFQAEFMHSKQFISSIQNNYLGMANRNADGSTYGFSVLYLTVNNIKDSRAAFSELTGKVDYSQIRYFSTGDYSFLFSYANNYNTDLSYGLNVKMVYRDYQAESAFGLGFDAAMQYRIWDHLQLGLMLRDITTTMMAWTSGEKEFITPSLRLGASYRLDLESVGLTMQPAVDFQFLFENRGSTSQLDAGPLSLDTFWGLEVMYRNTFSLRGGMDDLQRINAGVGLSIPKLTFHYSYTPDNNALGNIQRISVLLQLDSLF